jgi:hypothetical protein
MKYVMILNDPPYGTERSYNGLARRGWTPRSRFRYWRLTLSVTLNRQRRFGGQNPSASGVSAPLIAA